MTSWWWVKENKQMALVFITITIMLQLQMKGCVGCLESERTGLLELKSYLVNVITVVEKGFFPKSILRSWNHDAGNSDCCVWEEVQCEAAIGGHVVDLTLFRVQFTVKSPPPPLSLNLSLLHSFPQLRTLKFTYNWFSDLFDPIHGTALRLFKEVTIVFSSLSPFSLPMVSGYKSFQRLEKLRTLDLSGNLFSNKALPFLNAARSLKTLKLANNYVEGVFPPQGLINLRELEELDLNNNNLNGVQADNGYKSLERLKKLRTLNLSHNLLNNSALPFVSAARSLTTLNLRHNNLEGVFPPEEIANMTELRVLNMDGNLFGSFSVKGLINIRQLEVLDLSDNGINDLKAGYGYSEICRLSYLQELDLSNNSLTSLPNCLGNLTRLRTLDLSDNQLHGDPSSFVAGLPSALEYLSLLDNNFNDSFSFKSLVNQTRLTVFRMSSKVGTIQPLAESSWVPLFQLKTLWLRRFNFGSTIPGFLAHQHDLSFVDLSQNHMTGAFPIWLVQNNTRLEELFLKSNSLTKLQLPRIVHELNYLDISCNRIQDSIQEDIGIVFPELWFMNFSSNNFHGTIPSSMGKMKDLVFLDLSSNDLSGQLPETFLSGCQILLILKLSNNQFHGKVFPEHANFTALDMLFLDGNNFNGSLGKGLLNSEGLKLLDISNNSISGTLPLWMGRMSSLISLHMRENQVEGPFPSHLRMLQVLDISHNSFAGFIPRNLVFPSLEELRLQSNEFTGSVPDTLFKTEKLKVLDLRNNNFSGINLNTNGKRSELRVLLLRNNSFQTHIPEKICQVLSKLDLLDLSSNKFKGVIPSCLGSMSFGAAGNNGAGSFDRVISKFEIRWYYTTSMNIETRDLEEGHEATPIPAVEVLTKRRYETYRGEIIGDMYGLDLSSNELSGEIPGEIGNLENIISLDFSSNGLTGSIPQSISKLKNLGSLDLSNNKLDGSIPPQLADLNSLGYFNVSFNNLSGEIPFKGHLGSFDEKSYIGNPHLCGLPTNVSCNSTRAPEPTGAKEEEEEKGDDLIDMVWFYWTCGAVYISTLLALFAFLCIDTRWSREWFYRAELVLHHLHLFKNRFLCK